MIVWFTGLSGSGKTTILRELEVMLPGWVLIDGDPSLAIAAANTGVDVLCGAASEKRADRDAVRASVDEYFEIYVNTPLVLCKHRDKRGVYRPGKVNKPLLEYEQGSPDMTLCTVCHTPKENARKVYERLHAIPRSA